MPLKVNTDMVKWVPEAINNLEENNRLIADIIQNIGGGQPGQNLISIGGDTLIFGAVKDNGELDLYETTIRRVSRNVLADELALQPQFQIQHSDRLS
jgi:hypothetical protein